MKDRVELLKAKRERQRKTEAESKKQGQQFAKQLEALEKAIKGLKIETQNVDLSTLIKAVESIEIPVIDLSPVINQIKAIRPVVKIPETKIPQPKVITKQLGSDIFSVYIYVDSDDKEGNQYYGYMKPNGSWFIMRTADGENSRFTAGSGDYGSNWNKRRLLNYDYPNKVGFDIG